MFLKLSLFLVASLSTNSWANQDVYPFKYTPEVLEKNWMKVRVEGQKSSYLRNPFRFVGYSIKAFKKKFTGPQEAITHFEKTRQTFDELAEMKPEGESVRLSFVGDLMWLRTGWSGFLDDRLKKHFENSDFLFGNLETLISKSHKVPTFPPARATFNSPPSIIDEFKSQGGKNLFSALSVANNHSLDYGELGFKETLEVLNSRKIPFSGVLDNAFESSKKRWVLIEKSGLKVGFYAATYGMNNRWEKESKVDFNLLKGFAPLYEESKVDLKEIEGVLQEMKEASVDIKIISLHWGFEYEYYPEAKQVIVAREIVKKGADIIMGHHSHSQQPLDLCFVNGKEKGLKSYNFKSACTLKGEGRPRKALIIYGLGNFLTNMYGFLSEVGTVLDVYFIQNEEGYWDWHSPKVHLVYNERDYKNGEGEDPRTLLFMADYLAQNCFKKACPKDELFALKFLEILYPKSSFSLKLP